MSGELADLLANAQHDDARRQRPSHPKGWEPGIRLDREEATFVVKPGETRDTAFDALVRQMMPNAPVEMLDVVEVRAWGDPDDPYQYVRCKVRTGGPASVDLGPIIDEIRRHRPKKRKPPVGEQAFVVCISDTQFGKADGDGVDGTVARFLAAVDAVTQRIKELRRLGRPLGTLYVFGLGDIIEGCDQHYAQQTFTVQLNRRDQVKLARRLITKALCTWTPLFDRAVIACVPGNHGELRKAGKSFTDFGDNDDVAVFEQVAEVLAANPDVYGHVSFVIPDDRLTVTLDVAGTVVGLAHGHQFGRGAGSVAKAWNWWSGQAIGDQPIGTADLLLTGHFHHLVVQQQGRRTHIQCPALDGGSEWFTNMSGLDSPPGMLTLVTAGGTWTDLAVL